MSIPNVRWKTLIVVVVLIVVGVVALFVVRSDVCPSDSVLHPPAGSCINPRTLLVTGSLEDVADAVSEFEGTVLPFQGKMQQVRMPVGDLDELDKIKAALESAGFDVQYFGVYELD
jgi:hypothetical protein